MFRAGKTKKLPMGHSRKIGIRGGRDSREGAFQKDVAER